MLVVLFHLWPGVVRGGFVGVDVFLVISGYLITLHLSKSISQSNLSVTDFWARRIRRLLPASLLVLLLSGIAAPALSPRSAWSETSREIVASAFYVQNWALALNSVDYLANARPSSVEHYWSLSVEEQFYAFWPLVLLGAAAVARRRAGASPRRALLVATIGISVASFLYSVWATERQPGPAYFVTFTRIWEFGAGATIAIALRGPFGSTALRTLLAWVGLVAVIAAGLLYSAGTHFPGFAALVPVIGASAVVASMDVDGRWAPSRIGNIGVVRLLGDTSYSIYLWHWPLAILLSFAFGGVEHTLHHWQRVVILGLSVVLGWLSYRFVENRFRLREPSSATTTAHRRTFLRAAFAMGVVSIVGGIPWAIVRPRIREAETAQKRFLENPPSCYGADALAQRAPCTGENGVLPRPIIAFQDRPSDDCIQQRDSATVVSCTFGSSNTQATRVAIVGDSHIHHWIPAFETFAEKEGWSITAFTRGGCHFTDAPMRNKRCVEWNRRVAKSLIDGNYRIIFTTAYAPAVRVADKSFDTAVTGFRHVWNRLRQSGATVVAIADTPDMELGGLPDPVGCVDSHGVDPTLCSTDRDVSITKDPLRAASSDGGAQYINLNELLCDPKRCTAVVGGVLVYRDSDHMTSTYARSLGPYLLAAVKNLDVPR